MPCSQQRSVECYSGGGGGGGGGCGGCKGERVGDVFIYNMYIYTNTTRIFEILSFILSVLSIPSTPHLPDAQRGDGQPALQRRDLLRVLANGAHDAAPLRVQTDRGDKHVAVALHHLQAVAAAVSADWGSGRQCQQTGAAVGIFSRLEQQSAEWSRSSSSRYFQQTGVAEPTAAN